jgi:hypothetical protein
MNDFLLELKEGIQFLITLHPPVDVGKTLVILDGFPNFVVLLVLVTFGRTVYLIFNDYNFVNNIPGGKTGFIFLIVCLAIVLSGAASICLIFFYIYGALAGFLIGIKNGIRLRNQPILGIGVLVGFVLVGFLFINIPYEYSFTIQLSILIWLTWDTIKNSEFVINQTTYNEIYFYFFVSGIISLILFEEKSFNKLLIEASKTTSFQIKQDLLIIKVLSYLPLVGWPCGFFYFYRKQYVN